MLLKRNLPAELLEGGSKEAIRLGAGFLSTLAALWGARIANGPGLGQTWTVTVAMERLLADRVAEAARRAAEEAREAELLRAQNANLMTQTIQSAKEKMRKIKWDDD